MGRRSQQVITPTLLTPPANTIKLGVMKKTLQTTLVRIHRDTIPLMRELKAAMNIKYDREIIGIAINDLASRQANNTFNSIAKRTGVVHAKRRRIK